MDLISECQEKLKKLINCPNSRKRNNLLRKSKGCLINAISEISKNCLTGNLPLKKSEITKLKKYKKVLRFIANKNSLKKRRKVILQRGGFLNILIPSALHLLSELLSKN
jgi:hypothetical protein